MKKLKIVWGLLIIKLHIMGFLQSSLLDNLNNLQQHLINLANQLHLSLGKKSVDHTINEELKHATDLKDAINSVFSILEKYSPMTQTDNMPLTSDMYFGNKDNVLAIVEQVKKHFEGKEADLKVFASVGAAGLRQEYILLKILKFAGFNNIRTIVLTDLFHFNMRYYPKVTTKSLPNTPRLFKELKETRKRKDVWAFQSLDYFVKAFPEYEIYTFGPTEHYSEACAKKPELKADIFFASYPLLTALIGDKDYKKKVSPINVSENCFYINLAFFGMKKSSGKASYYIYQANRFKEIEFDVVIKNPTT